MMNSEVMCSISPGGETIALCTSDGVVKFYDSLTGSLKLEYSSSTHLQASCTCLSWPTIAKSSSKKNSTDGSKKKTKTAAKSQSIESELNDLNLIALGTSQGVILLFSLTKAELHTQLSDGGHSDKITDIVWPQNGSDSLYSCSEDGYIIEWSLLQGKVVSKWKASKTGITAMAIDPSSKYLLCASKTITVWDLSTKTKLKNLTGHATDIFRIEFLNNKTEDKYAISAAVNERILNLWNVSSENGSDSTAALASFTLNEPSVSFSLVGASFSDQDGLILSAINNKGQLYLFCHENSSTTKSKKLKKPIKSALQLRVETKESGEPLKIYGAYFVNSENVRVDTVTLSQSLSSSENNSLSQLLSQYSLFIVYGSHLNPKIEKLSFSDLNESKVVLKRDDPYKTTVSLQTQANKIETPSVSKELKVLVPGYSAAPQANNQLTNSKRKSTEPNQMTLEERLNVMGIDSNNDTGLVNDELYNSNGSSQVPKTDNLLVLLVQGLQSNDAKMLNHVLQHKNDKVINKTVRLLPNQYVVSLVKELNKRLQGHAQAGVGIIKWLKSVLTIHTSYLMSYPDLIESLGSVYEMMNARTKLFPQLSKLQGKLQLVMSQVSSQAENVQAGGDKSKSSDQPLLYYQDSTSEDEQIEDELIPSHSEYDEYRFSDEDESEEEDEDDDDDEDEEMEDDEMDGVVAKRNGFHKTNHDEDDDDQDEDDDDD